MEKTWKRAKKDIVLHEQLKAKKIKLDDNFKTLLDKVFSDKEEYESIKQRIDEITSSEQIPETLIKKRKELRKN